MKGQIITIEPEIIHFNRQNIQTIKIINNTSTQLSNFFFCLYNVQKFAFNPESFSLAPNQHKLVQVTLRIKSTKSIAKQFAYLKSSEVNKRLTLLINNFQSPQVKTRQTQQGYSDMNTLSSRDYNQLQNKALNKIIKQQQFYIAKNQNEFRQSASKTSQFSSPNMKEIESKNIFLQKQISQMSLEYQKKCIQLDRVISENQFLQEQGSKFLKKLSQKEQRIKQLQSKLRKFQQLIQQKESLFQQKLQQENKLYQQQFKNYQQKIKQLEEFVQKSDTNRSNSNRQDIQNFKKKFGEQIQKKQQELLELKNILEHHELLVKQHQTNVAKLQSKNKQLQSLNTNLKEQIFVYKSKNEENNYEKMTKYLQMALQSCKNQNQLLKQSKKQLQKSLQVEVNTFRQKSQITKQLQKNLEQANSELQILKKQLQQLQKINFSLAQQKQSLLKDSEIKQIQIKQLTQNKINQNLQNTKQIEQLRDQNMKLLEKVKKYKKQAKKQLKSINDNAFDELKRIHEQKKALSRRVAQLQETISNLDSNEKTRIKSKSKIQYVGFGQSLQHQRPKSHQHHQNSTKLVGIKNQRKQLQQSRTNSLRENSNFETVYNQLMELRQVQNYVRQQQDKFVQIFNLQQLLNSPHLQEKNTPMRPIYRCIKFFKVIQTKLRNLQQRADQSVYVCRQNQFMKGRLAQIQRKQNQTQINQSMLGGNNVNKITVNDQNNTSSILLNKSHLNISNHVQMLDFMKDQMKRQYKKLTQALKFSEQKYEILKKKIYRQYRSRIIDLLSNKKDKQQIMKIQSTIERFVEGLSNTSHKEAVLNKQIKVKQILKMDNIKLKQKLHEAQHLLKQKHGYCNRQPLKVYTCVTNSAVNIKQQDYIESLKLATQLLTQNAQNQRLKEELQILRQDLNDIRQQMNQMNEANQGKDQEIIKLKKNQIQLQNSYQDELKKQNQILENTRQKYLNTKGTKNTSSSILKESQRQVQSLKQELDKKTSQLREYKQKQKNWQQFIQQSNRTQSKQNKIQSDYRRIQQNLFQIKENNQYLKKENEQLICKIQKLQEDLQRKKAYINLLKGQDQENRIKIHKNSTIDSNQVQKLKEQIKLLAAQLYETKEECSKLKKKKDKDFAKMESQYNSSKNAAILHIKSLESVVRAILETIRKLYSSLKIIIKKKGLSLAGKQFEAPTQLTQIDAIKIYEQFQNILEVLQS